MPRRSSVKRESASSTGTPSLPDVRRPLLLPALYAGSAILQGYDAYSTMSALKAGGIEQVKADWKTLVTDNGAKFDKEVVIDAATITPSVTWGTNPGQVTTINGVVPDPASFADPAQRSAAGRSRTRRPRFGIFWDCRAATADLS